MEAPIARISIFQSSNFTALGFHAHAGFSILTKKILPVSHFLRGVAKSRGNVVGLLGNGLALWRGQKWQPCDGGEKRSAIPDSAICILIDLRSFTWLVLYPLSRFDKLLCSKVGLSMLRVKETEITRAVHPTMLSFTTVNNKKTIYSFSVWSLYALRSISILLPILRTVTLRTRNHSRTAMPARSGIEPNFCISSHQGPEIRLITSPREIMGLIFELRESLCVIGNKCSPRPPDQYEWFKPIFRWVPKNRSSSH